MKNYERYKEIIDRINSGSSDHTPAVVDGEPHTCLVKYEDLWSCEHCDFCKLRSEYASCEDLYYIWAQSEYKDDNAGAADGTWNAEVNKDEDKRDEEMPVKETNLDHFRDELIEIWSGGSQFAVDKRTSMPVGCFDIACCNCLFKDSNCQPLRNIWLKDEYEETIIEIDWSRVPVDTKIILNDDKEYLNERRYFASYDSYRNMIEFFLVGTTSWSSDAKARIEADKVKLFDPEDIEKYKKR